MLKTLCEILKNNVRIEIFMSVVLLISMTAIACNMDKVAEMESESESKKGIVSNGKAVVIDAGHGGADPGKVGVNGTKEKDVNLKIAAALEARLRESGYQTVMTRTTDEALGQGGKFSKVGDLNERCRIINDTYASNENSVMVSIHQNSFTQQSVHGAQCFYYQRSEESKRLAELIQKFLNEEINTEKEKKTKPNDSYYMLINSDCPAVILECGFLSNSEEEKKLNDGEYQKKLAKIVKKSLDMYFQIE